MKQILNREITAGAPNAFSKSANSPVKIAGLQLLTNRSPSVSRNTFHTGEGGPTIHSRTSQT
jgi:hypothetical protein